MGQTTRTPITPPTWSGLPILDCAHAETERRLDFEIESPKLALWLAGGATIDIHRAGRQHWHYQAAAGRFDYCAAGAYKSFHADGVASRKLVVLLPPEWTSTPMADEAVQFWLESCRYQFVDPLLERLVRRLAQHASRVEPLGGLYTQALSAAIVSRLSTNAGRAPRHTATGGLGVMARRNLVDLIESRLGAPPSIADMALLSGLRTSEFLKAFSLSFGLTPHQYLLERRVERAKLLIGESRPLTGIAIELGFASHAHFSATFRARTGQTPSAYRENARTPCA